MGKEKKGKTQKSTVTLKQVWDALVEHGFSCEKPEDQIDRGFRTSRRRDGWKTQGKFGDNSDVSRLGRSVTFHGQHVKSGHPASFELRNVHGTLGHGELDALRVKTGIDLFRAVADPDSGESEGTVTREPELVRQRGSRRGRSHHFA